MRSLMAGFCCCKYYTQLFYTVRSIYYEAYARPLLHNVQTHTIQTCLQTSTAGTRVQKIKYPRARANPKRQDAQILSIHRIARECARKTILRSQFAHAFAIGCSSESSSDSSPDSSLCDWLAARRAMRHELLHSYELFAQLWSSESSAYARCDLNKVYKQALHKLSKWSNRCVQNVIRNHVGSIAIITFGNSIISSLLLNCGNKTTCFYVACARASRMMAFYRSAVAQKEFHTHLRMCVMHTLVRLLHLIEVTACC